MFNYQRFSTQAGFSDTDVLDMRDLAKRTGLSATAIGGRFGIDRTTAGRIISGRTWSHVPSPKNVNGYTVYPDGRVYSKTSSRFLATTNGKNGLTVRLGDQHVLVAYLVAKAFVNSSLRMASKISFRDGDSRNVHFTNLIVKK